MTYTIYTIGDAGFLFNVLDAVRAIFAGGNGATAYIFKISLLLGILFAMARALMSGADKVPFAEFLVMIIIYLALFVNTEDVIIEDLGTQLSGDYVVQDVPMGVVVIGSTVSLFGKEMTELFQQAFGEPNPELMSYDALERIQQLRRKSMVIIGADPVQQMQWSVRNFVEKCTALRVLQGDTTWAKILSDDGLGDANAYNFLEAIKFDTVGASVDVYNQAGNVVLVSCTEAHDMIVASESDIHAALEKVVNEIAHDDPNNTGTGVNTFDAEAYIGDALSKIGVTVADTQNYSTSMALLAPAMEGVQAHNTQFGDPVAAEMLQSAIDNRNTQWAAQASLFEETVKPLMTFFEGLILALTPLVVAALGLGMIGFKMFGTFFAVMMWIQLWAPLTAIVNHYLWNVVNTTMVQLNTNIVAPAGSPVAQLAMDQEMQNWLATGGMLLSSVPALAAFITFGGSVAFTQLSGRATSGEFVNSKLATPETRGGQPAIATASNFAADAISGTGVASADSFFASFGKSRDHAESQSSEAAYAREQGQAWTSAAQEALSQQFTAGQSASEQQSKIEGLGFSTQASKDFSQGITNRFGDTVGFGNTSRESIAAAASAATLLQAGVGTGGAIPFAKLQATIASSLRATSEASGATDTQINEQASALASIAQSDDFEIARNESQQSQRQAAAASNWGASSGNATTQSLGHQLQESTKAQQALRNTVQKTERSSDSHQYGITQASALIAGNDAAFQKLQNEFRAAGGTAGIEQGLLKHHADLARPTTGNDGGFFGTSAEGQRRNQVAAYAAFLSKEGRGHEVWAATQLAQNNDVDGHAQLQDPTQLQAPISGHNDTPAQGSVQSQASGLSERVGERLGENPTPEAIQNSIDSTGNKVSQNRSNLESAANNESGYLSKQDNAFSAAIPATTQSQYEKETESARRGLESQPKLPVGVGAGQSIEKGNWFQRGLHALSFGRFGSNGEGVDPNEGKGEFTREELAGYTAQNLYDAGSSFAKSVGANEGQQIAFGKAAATRGCLLYTSPSPRDGLLSRMPSSA